MAKRHGTLLFTLAPAAAATAPGALISNLRQHREVPMRKKHFARSLLGSFAIAAGLLFPIEADAQEGVDFRAIAQPGRALPDSRLADRDWLCRCHVFRGLGPGHRSTVVFCSRFSPEKRSFSLSQVRPQT